MSGSERRGVCGWLGRVRLGLRCICGLATIHAQLSGGKVKLRVFNEGGLRLGRVKVTWSVDWGLNSSQGCSQMVEPAFLVWLRKDGPSKTRMWIGLTFKSKGLAG